MPIGRYGFRSRGIFNLVWVSRTYGHASAQHRNRCAVTLFTRMNLAATQKSRTNERARYALGFTFLDGEVQSAPATDPAFRSLRVTASSNVSMGSGATEKG